jgi:hypothetical protein
MEISYVKDARHSANIPINRGKLYPTIRLESFQHAKVLKYDYKDLVSNPHPSNN